MGKFQQAMLKLAEGIDDLSKLDVVTYEGSVVLTGDTTAPMKFSDVMSKALASDAEVKAKVLASTQTSIDGDVVVFYDKDITDAQRLAHEELVKAGSESRKATIEFVKSVIGDIADL